MRTVLAIGCFLSAGTCLAQQQPTLDPTIQALYERYQRADNEAIQLRAAVIKLEREVADLRKADKPPEVEK